MQQWILLLFYAYMYSNLQQKRSINLICKFNMVFNQTLHALVVHCFIRKERETAVAKELCLSEAANGKGRGKKVAFIIISLLIGVIIFVNNALPATIFPKTSDDEYFY